MANISTIQGGKAEDHRGQIRFVNDFDMSLVKRFYIIKNLDTELIRGWRAHRVEQRWFYVLSGAFSIDLIEIDNWETPDPCLPVINKILTANEMRLLHVSAGFGTAFRALEPGSELLVYADRSIADASLDDYTWHTNYFLNYQP
ncbi:MULTISPECIES: WxcM-like domain-containing protein [unclassified Sphingobacterium]|uniref:WxcM-like domain-containing protein n=1 Tax=unclassified Sphingobacterium TaxID=2609468 RepID=UPI0025FFB9A9|nr:MULTISPECIES: WxcM-like domain-containing protein [unclassified Sphingobacterium]